MNSKAYKSYEIAPNVYHELKYLCLQYDDMRREIKNCYGLSGVSYDSSGAAGSSVSNPTAERAERAMRLAADVETIDKALVQTADEPVRGYIKRAVTNNLKYEFLDGVPMGRQQFYEARRKFFYHLKVLKKG